MMKSDNQEKHGQLVVCPFCGFPCNVRYEFRFEQVLGMYSA